MVSPAYSKKMKADKELKKAEDMAKYQTPVPKTTTTTSKVETTGKKETSDVPLYTSKTGEVTGFEKNGSTFLRPPGISDEEWFGNIEKLSAEEARKTLIPKGAVSKTQQAELEYRRQAINQMGQPQMGQVIPGQPEENGIIGSSIAAGLGQGLIGAAGGATIGAALAPATAGTSVPIAAGAGFIGGFVRGFVNKMKEERSQRITAEFVTMSKASRNLRMLINDVNQGGDPYENMELFQQELTALDDAYSKLHSETNTNLNKFLSVDAQVEMAKFEDFNTFSRPQFVRDMQQAILNPNPNKILLNEDDYTAVE